MIRAGNDNSGLDGASERLWFCMLLVFACLPSRGAADSRLQQTDPASSEEEVFSLETLDTEKLDDSRRSAKAWDKLTENLRFNLDFISRVETTRRRGKAAAMQAFGFDIHKVLSDESGDIATLLLQPYIVRRDNALPLPPHVEDDDDWELEFHDFYINITRWGRGRTNLKIGHFDVPYGLEPIVDTHFTMHQLIPFQNIGTKKDWGVSINGTLPAFDYELAVTQGTVFEYNSAGKNYSIAGRIGTPTDQNFVIGASFFYGQVIDPHRLHRWEQGLAPLSHVDRARRKIPGGGRGDDDIVRRVRAGLDVSWIVDQFTLRGEFSVGRDYNQDVFNSLLEVDWASADQRLSTYAQAIYLGQRSGFGWDEDVIARIGARWRVDEHWTISGQYSHDLKTYGTRPEDAKFVFQTRWSF